MGVKKFLGNFLLNLKCVFFQKKERSCEGKPYESNQVCLEASYDINWPPPGNQFLWEISGTRGGDILEMSQTSIMFITKIQTLENNVI